jgi:hypothetical protein
MPSTIEALERELGEVQREREDRERAVARAENAHEAACSARDEAWSELPLTDPQVERLTTLVYRRRRELYEAIDRLRGVEGKERRIKSRLMYVLPSERHRYLSGIVDEEFERFLAAVRAAYLKDAPGARLLVMTEQPGEMDLRGDATWRALERLYSETTRRWVEIRVPEGAAIPEEMSRTISHYAGGHLPRVFAGGRETRLKRRTGAPDSRPLEGFGGAEGELALARVTLRRYLDESGVGRLGKHPESLVKLAYIARLYQTMALTGDEVRWRLEQLVPLRLEALKAVHTLTESGRRFSFYEISRAARLLDGHFPDPDVAAEALLAAVDKALETGVPLVDIAYLSVTSGE